MSVGPCGELRGRTVYSISALLVSELVEEILLSHEAAECSRSSFPLLRAFHHLLQYVWHADFSEGSSFPLAGRAAGHCVIGVVLFPRITQHTGPRQGL